MITWKKTYKRVCLILDLMSRVNKWLSDYELLNNDSVTYLTIINEAIERVEQLSEPITELGNLYSKLEDLIRDDEFIKEQKNDLGSFQELVKNGVAQQVLEKKRLKNILAGFMLECLKKSRASAQYLAWKKNPALNSCIIHQLFIFT